MHRFNMTESEILSKITTKLKVELCFVKKMMSMSTKKDEDIVKMGSIKDGMSKIESLNGASSSNSNNQKVESINAMLLNNRSVEVKAEQENKGFESTKKDMRYNSQKQEQLDKTSTQDLKSEKGLLQRGVIGEGVTSKERSQFETMFGCSSCVNLNEEVVDLND